MEVLLNEVRTLKQLWEEFFRNNQQIREYEKKPMNIRWWGHILLYFIVFGNILRPLMFKVFPFLYGHVFFELIVGITLYTLIYQSINNSLHKKRLLKYKKQLKILKHRNGQIVLETQSLRTSIPDDYMHLSFLKAVEKYIENKRIESLKEAINLYEVEQRHNEQIQEIYTLQQLQQKTYKETQQATTLGWMNLFRR
jgi:hypothetical protein